MEKKKNIKTPTNKKKSKTLYLKMEQTTKKFQVNFPRFLPTTTKIVYVCRAAFVCVCVCWLVGKYRERSYTKG